MAWIESHQELADHPKTKRLRRALGVSLPTAVGHLHLLWWWALSHAEDGSLADIDDEDIAEEAGWEGEPSVFVEALLSSGFLNADRTLHDWYEYAGRWIEKRRADAERKRMSRGQTAPSAPRPQDVRRTSEGRRAPSGVTGPNLTGPNQDLTGDEVPTTAVVVEPQSRPKAEKARPKGGSVVLSEDARAVVEEWRRAHGKPRPPPLNPTQAATLETALAELGVARLMDGMRWSAEQGLGKPDQFVKAIRAAYTKRQQDEAREQGGTNGAAPVPTGGASGDRFAAFRKFS